MVQIRLTRFKTGAKVNPKLNFNMNNLTSFQKMELVRCRIWGNTIGDNFASGSKILKRELNKAKAYIYEGVIPTDHFPWVEDWDHFHTKKLEIHDRRSRILMRGVKIGQRKGVSEGKMSIFDTKKSTPSV